MTKADGRSRRRGRGNGKSSASVMRRFNNELRPTSKTNPPTLPPSINTDPGWTVWVRIPINYSGSGFYPLNPGTISVADAVLFGITLYTSRWYTMNVHEFRFYAPASAQNQQIELDVYDFTNGSDPLIDQITIQNLGGTTVPPEPIGRRFGKVISQYNVPYSSPITILAMTSGPAGLYQCDFRVTFR